MTESFGKTTDARAGIAARYLRFADEEARGRSPLYEVIARGVAADEDSIAFLLTLPGPKRQPNLLLAAVRHLFGTPAGWNELAGALRHAAAHPRAAASTPGADRGRRLGRAVPAARPLWLRLRTRAPSGGRGGADVPLRRQRRDAGPGGAASHRLARRAGPQSARHLGRWNDRMARSAGLARADRAARQPARRRQGRCRGEAAHRAG
jgi:hypothetical protein